MKIISGGQTGADQAALDAALELGLAHGGWLPQGRRTENGPLPAHYRLRELPTRSYRKRTEQNVLDSDATLILSHGPLHGGSALTEALAIRHDRPCLHLDLNLIPLDSGARALEKWLLEHRITVLNVAGPRASNDPEIYKATRNLLRQINWPGSQVRSG